MKCHVLRPLIPGPPPLLQQIVSDNFNCNLNAWLPTFSGRIYISSSFFQSFGFGGTYVQTVAAAAAGIGDKVICTHTNKSFGKRINVSRLSLLWYFMKIFQLAGFYQFDNNTAARRYMTQLDLK